VTEGFLPPAFVGRRLVGAAGRSMRGVATLDSAWRPWRVAIGWCKRDAAAEPPREPSPELFIYDDDMEAGGPGSSPAEARVGVGAPLEASGPPPPPPWPLGDPSAAVHSRPQDAKGLEGDSERLIRCLLLSHVKPSTFA
jgi:hypothetical protein